MVTWRVFWVVMSPTSVRAPRTARMGTRSTPTIMLLTGSVLAATCSHPPAAQSACWLQSGIDSWAVLSPMAGRTARRAHRGGAPGHANSHAVYSWLPPTASRLLPSLCLLMCLADLNDWLMDRVLVDSQHKQPACSVCQWCKQWPRGGKPERLENLILPAKTELL